MQIQVVTDSTSDLSVEIALRYHIELMPNNLVINNESFKDGHGLSREIFYSRLPNLTSPPTTATASSGEYLNLYQRIFQTGIKQILSIHPPSSLSGIINAASAAAKMSEGPVYVLDCGQVTMGMGFQAITAAQAASDGASLPNILELISQVRNNTRLIAMLDTLEYVRRSGRASWAQSRLSNFFDLKHFIELREGHVFSLGEARTRKKGIQRLGEMLQKLGKLKRMVILHTNAEQDAAQFLSQYQHLSVETPWLCNVTTVIGTHVGPNGLGFVVEIDSQ